MTLPLWMLLGFAAWTVSLLMFTIGIYRWRRILTRRASISSFRSDQVEGEDWYRRAMRAHANCVENLPVFGAIVLALYAADIAGTLVNVLATAVLIGRMVQSLVHVCFTETDTTVSVRFSFFSVQLLCFLWLIGIIVARLGFGG